MPLYEYACRRLECGRRFDVFKRVAELDREERCQCGEIADRQIVKTLAVRGMFEPYVSEASGRVITTPSQRRDDLARTGCIEYDPEMRKDVQRSNEEADKKFDQLLDRSLGETLQNLNSSGA